MQWKTSRLVFCELKSEKPATTVQVQKLIRGCDVSPPATTGNVNIVLQPRLCTLRSYGSDQVGVMKLRKDGGAVSSFFPTLSDYIRELEEDEQFKESGQVQRATVEDEQIFVFRNPTSSVEDCAERSKEKLNRVSAMWVALESCQDHLQFRSEKEAELA
ncbi:hypothetical protein Vadar_013582 [Vaccinium darrowii]|uniref:Uncharacterized protein n=1 Tax=Vaccinium darrowii TaxID=229202 RepID=A0ACB7XQI5_9ERIC|nr:hypothetical protein Vadar_013582 [Vaccinium darrowii]